MTTDRTAPLRVSPSKVRLARALVRDARRRGTVESDWIEKVAKVVLPGDKKV